MPDFFQKLSYLEPLRYMVTIIRGVTLKSAPWPNLAILVSRLFYSRSAHGASGSSKKGMMRSDLCGILTRKANPPRADFI
jgi:hypothetical protein